MAAPRHCAKGTAPQRSLKGLGTQAAHMPARRMPWLAPSSQFVPRRRLLRFRLSEILAGAPPLRALPIDSDWVRIDQTAVKNGSILQLSLNLETARPGSLVSRAWSGETTGLGGCELAMKCKSLSAPDLVWRIHSNGMAQCLFAPGDVSDY